ncbi:unnamed protein product, partial [Symbiodinium necroappetens]
DRLARWLEHAGENETVDASGDTDLSEVQGAWDRVHELREELKALTGVEVSTRVSEGDGADTVLQTRTVSLPEVLANWEVWEHPANKEISALVEEKRALIPVDWKQVQRWKESGKRVTTIPAKAVWTVKAPDGRHKCRIVACGNMAPSKDESRQDHKDAVFASSLDVTHLRCALAVATRRSYEIAITDIRTAFLNAELLPRERVKAEQAAAAAADGESVPIDEIVILLPPRCLIQRGLVGRNTLWQVAKAIYGLDTSPRDWSLSRDFTLRRLAVKFQGHRSTEADDDDGVAWRFWIGVVVLVVCCWEGLKLGIRLNHSRCRQSSERYLDDAIESPVRPPDDRPGPHVRVFSVEAQGRVLSVFILIVWSPLLSGRQAFGSAPAANRWHRTPRIQLFHPGYAREEIGQVEFTGRRRTLVYYTATNRYEIVDDDFTDPVGTAAAMPAGGAEILQGT